MTRSLDLPGSPPDATRFRVELQMAVYAGIPAALNALNLAKDAFEERDAKGLS